EVSLKAIVNQSERDANRYRSSPRAKSGDWKFGVGDRTANWTLRDPFQAVSNLRVGTGPQNCGPLRRSLTKSPNSGNAWLTTHFCRTRLCRANSLETGKVQGIFLENGFRRRNRWLFVDIRSKA